MIKSFKHKGLKRYFFKNDASGLNPDQINKIWLILTTLNITNNLQDIKSFKNFKFHELKGDLDGFYSVTVSANYRIIFKFDNNNVFDVDLIDYH